jgi:archaemetzincin
VEDHAAGPDPLAAPEPDLVAEVVDQQVAVAGPGQRDQRRDHLDPGPDRVDRVSVAVEGEVRREDVVPRERDRPGLAGPDIDGTDPTARGHGRLGRGRVRAAPDLDYRAVPGADVCTDRPLDLFNGAVRHTYTVRFALYWDHRSPQGLQRPVQRRIERILGAEGSMIEPNGLLLTGFDMLRRQYSAPAVLTCLEAARRRRGWQDPVLLVVPDDLYAPGEEFVFGLARPERGMAVVSTARLHNHFYGRVPCDDDLMDRVAKEGAHEIGHLLGLEHCDERECVMYAPRSLDELDRKRKMVCPACTARLRGG